MGRTKVPPGTIFETGASSSLALSERFRKLTLWEVSLNIAPLLPQQALLDMRTQEFGLARFTTSFLGADFNAITGVVVAFRGTPMTSIDTWAKNLETELRPFPHARNGPTTNTTLQVHKGFLDIFEQIPLDMWTTNRLELGQVPREIPIYFVGHSLGGALAAFAAMIFKEWHPELNVRLFMLHSPRVGNEAFAHYISGALPNIVRWVQSNDIVSSIPSSSLYAHFGTEVWWTAIETRCCDAFHYETCSGGLHLIQSGILQHHAIGYETVFGPLKCFMYSES
jgi:hypothetical protein